MVKIVFIDISTVAMYFWWVVWGLPHNFMWQMEAKEVDFSGIQETLKNVYGITDFSLSSEVDKKNNIFVDNALVGFMPVTNTF